MTWKDPPVCHGEGAIPCPTQTPAPPAPPPPPPRPKCQNCTYYCDERAGDRCYSDGDSTQEVRTWGPPFMGGSGCDISCGAKVFNRKNLGHGKYGEWKASSPCCCQSGVGGCEPPKPRT